MVSPLGTQLGAALDRLAIREGTALVAVSGGPDSIVLLDLMTGVAVDRRLTLVVAHFDHGIHPDSGAVADRVEGFARARGLSFVGGTGALGPLASETRAREHRLAWLEQVRERHGASWILTAHHQDDQVETLVMRFLNGSGPAGLAGIAESRGAFCRPLLGVSRQVLRGHLSAAGLEAWDDPANANPQHLRGWVRHRVLPPLKERLPALVANLTAAAGHFQEHRLGWDRLLEEISGVDFQPEPGGASVAAAGLAGYSSVIVRGLVRALGQRLGVRLGRGPVGRVEALLMTGRTGQRVDLLSGWCATLEFDRLRLFRPLGHPVEYEVPLPTADGVIEAGGWSLSTTRGVAPMELGRAEYSTWLEPLPPLSVRSWLPGDRVRPLGGAGSRLVVRCMQEMRIPRHRRPNWPVVVARDQIIWVPGVCRSGARLPAPGTEATRIDASPR